MTTSPGRETETTQRALAEAIRGLAIRCANEGWPMQAETLLHEAEALSAGLFFPGTMLKDRSNPDTSPKATFEIENFGRFQIRRKGKVLAPCHSARALWVWRYLLSTPHRMAHKGELATRLWPNATGERAYHSLHVAVAALRLYLDDGGERSIRFGNDCYMLRDDLSLNQDSECFQSLVEQGKQLARDGQLQRAEEALTAGLALYTGDYDLSGLDFAWAIVEQQKYVAAYLDALDSAGTIAFEQERYGQAIARFRQVLARDPYREDILAKLMTAFHRLGRRSDAAREYARCAFLLARDLSVEPSSELKHVYRALLGIDPSANIERFLQHESGGARRLQVRIVTLEDED